MRAISFFSRDAGISTLACRAISAFRTRVSISAMGSAVIYFLPSAPFITLSQRVCPGVGLGCYQLAFVTPGISPASANLRIQIRQSENLRKKPRGRPQFLQRLRIREGNFTVVPFCRACSMDFSFFTSFAIFAVVAIQEILLSTGGTACPCAAAVRDLRRLTLRWW